LDWKTAPWPSSQKKSVPRKGEPSLPSAASSSVGEIGA